MTDLTKLRSLVTVPDPGAEVEVRRRLDQLTKPPGSLGRLEELVVRLATIAGTCPPPLRDPVIFTLAGDHGVNGAPDQLPDRPGRADRHGVREGRARFASGRGPGSGVVSINSS